MSDHYTEAVNAIVALEDEEQLSRLGHLIHDQLKEARRKAGRKNLMQMKVGSRVRIVHDIRPKMYAGAEGVVRMMPTTSRSNKVSVQLDGHTSPLRVPANALILIDAA